MQSATVFSLSEGSNRQSNFFCIYIKSNYLKINPYVKFHKVQCFWSNDASEVTTLWRYTNLFNNNTSNSSDYFLRTNLFSCI